MKKFRTLALSLLAAICATTTEVNAQVFSENAKVVYKPTKAVKKEAKRLAKQGWAAEAGSMPMDEQLQRAIYFQKDVTQDGTAKYAVGAGKSKAQFYDAARAQAIELARLNAASQLKAELVAEAQTTLGNEQAEHITSLVSTDLAMKSIVSQKLTQTIIILEISRELPDGNCEVQIRIAAERAQIIKDAKRAIREEMKKRGDKILKDLDNKGWGN